MAIDIAKIKADALKDIEASRDSDSLDSVRVKYLGRKSEINVYLKNIKNLDSEERAQLGQETNAVKQEIKKALDQKNERDEREGGI